MKNFKCTSWRDYKFQRKHDCLKNCNFFVGDVTKTANYLEKDSQDLILCRYVLYHLDEESKEKAVKELYVNTLLDFLKQAAFELNKIKK